MLNFVNNSIPTEIIKLKTQQALTGMTNQGLEGKKFLLNYRNVFTATAAEYFQHHPHYPPSV